MIQANFNALCYYDSNIFHNSTWEEFVCNHATVSRHITNSKYIRQVILGNCNCKRQIDLEKYIMDNILGLASYHVFGMNDVIFFSNDEIIIEVYENEDMEEKYSRIHEFTKMLSIPLKTELFALHKIQGANGYIKECHIINDNMYGIKRTNTLSIKGVDAYIYPFVVRKLLGQEIQEEDKVFFHNGLLCKYEEVPEITFSNKTIKFNKKIVDIMR